MCSIKNTLEVPINIVVLNADIELDVNDNIGLFLAPKRQPNVLASCHVVFLVLARRTLSSWSMG